MGICKKFLLIFLITNILFLTIGLNVYEVKADFISDMEHQATNFINAGQSNAGNLTNVTNSITKNFTGVGQLLTLIGAGVMVAVVAYMGIKYLTSSPDKQAALKQQLIGVVTAGIVIFGAYGIWKALVKMFSNL